MNDSYRIELPVGTRVSIQYVDQPSAVISKSEAPTDSATAGYVRQYVVSIPLGAEVTVVQVKETFRVVRITGAEMFLLGDTSSSPRSP
jgi:hypothetical protein